MATRKEEQTFDSKRIQIAYHFVKEFGEGFDRICREQEANGATVPSFRTDEFILKITVPKVSEKVNVNVTEKVDATENVTENYRLDKGGSLYFNH